MILKKCEILIMTTGCTTRKWRWFRWRVNVSQAKPNQDRIPWMVCELFCTICYEGKIVKLQDYPDWSKYFYDSVELHLFTIMFDPFILVRSLVRSSIHSASIHSFLCLASRRTRPPKSTSFRKRMEIWKKLTSEKRSSQTTDQSR
jgi:hypothetical protein